MADMGVLLQLVWKAEWTKFISTMDSLSFCCSAQAAEVGHDQGYTCFGFASMFFSVVGSFAPLQAFPASRLEALKALRCFFVFLCKPL